MQQKEFEIMKATKLAPGFLEEYCCEPKLVGTEGLVRVAFDAVNNEPCPIHGRCIEELGERLAEGAGEYSVPALIALGILSNSESWFVQEPATKALNAYYSNKFGSDLRKLSPETIAELLELGQDVHSPAQYVILMDHIGKRAFQESLGAEASARIAKVAVKLLCHERQDVVFEAAFVLKELKEPSSYPHILKKLMDKDTKLELEVRRVLRAAAENIAMMVTGQLYDMTSKYRRGEWNLRVFERMRKHGAMLRELEAGPEPKLPGKLKRQKK